MINKWSRSSLGMAQSLPWRIGAITAAALVMLHYMHDRTT